MNLTRLLAEPDRPPHPVASSPSVVYDSASHRSDEPAQFQHGKMYCQVLHFRGSDELASSVRPPPPPAASSMPAEANSALVHKTAECTWCTTQRVATPRSRSLSTEPEPAHRTLAEAMSDKRQDSAEMATENEWHEPDPHLHTGLLTNPSKRSQLQATTEIATRGWCCPKSTEKHRLQKESETPPHPVRLPFEYKYDTTHRSEQRLPIPWGESSDCPFTGNLRNPMDTQP